MSVLYVAPAAAAAGGAYRVPTAAMLLQNMQVWRYCTARYGTREEAQHQPRCRLQVAGAWNLGPMGIVILRMKRMDQLGRGEKRHRKGPHIDIPARWQARMKIARALVLTNGSKKTGLTGPFLGNFCGLQRRSKVQGTRSRVRLDIWKMALPAPPAPPPCVMSANKTGGPTRSRLARPYMRAEACWFD